MRPIQNVRPDRQTVLFSATFPRSVEALARKVLLEPVEIQVRVRVRAVHTHTGLCARTGLGVRCHAAARDVNTRQHLRRVKPGGVRQLGTRMCGAR